MRWTARILLVLALAWGAYFVWPYVVFYRLADAIQARDVAAIAERVDFPSVRQSLTEQIARTYLRQTGREARLGAYADLAVAATASAADPIIAALLSPEALAELIRTGWPAALLSERPPAAVGLDAGSLGSAWDIWTASSHGLRSFAVSVPVTASEPRRFRLRFRFSRWAWRLAAIELPDELRVRLTQELIRSLNKK